METKECNWLLVQFDRFQHDVSYANGTVILEGDNANGFLERIVKDGFTKYCYQIQYRNEHGQKCVFSHLGVFHQTQLKNAFNALYTNAMKNIGDILTNING